MSEAARKKTYVEDISRDLYDEYNPFTYSYKAERGLTPDIVREISKRKNEPSWMTEFRLQSLDIYYQLDVPPWGPNLDELDIDNIITYVKPPTDMRYSWDDVPEDIKNTFVRLGIPQAEHASLAGVGAQYDSEVVYHSVKESIAKQGVVYLDMESALREYEGLIKEYFMSLVPPSDHKFAALHGAVWSGDLSCTYLQAGTWRFPYSHIFGLTPLVRDSLSTL